MSGRTLRPRVLVVGGGPGGYVAAIRAGQLGLETVLVEAGRPGGTCLTRGCIPSKAIIHAADLFAETSRAAAQGGHLGIRLAAPPTLDLAATMRWKDGIVDRLSNGVTALLRRAQVTVLKGWASFADAKSCTVETAEGPVKIEPEHVILATGSLPVELPSLPFGGDVLSSTEALALTELPRTLAVVGAGYIGLELGIAFAKLGVRVALVEAAERILPLYDELLTRPVLDWLHAHDVELHLQARAGGRSARGLDIETPLGDRFAIPAEKILVTVGRKPNTQGWGLETMAIEMDGRFIKVDERCATSSRNVWAIGDVTGEPMLAHRASAQGEMVAEIIAGKRRRFDPVAIPAICFTEPEIVTVGVERADENHVVGQFPFMANGRALSMEAGDSGGFVRTVAEKGSGRIVGLQAVGRHVSELASGFVALIEMGATLEDVAGMIHAHPTLGEAVHESALKALGHAIHV
ncbi:dihydrolipoyl dehydrogenase [Sphingobium lignivorans]|uniref:Dihydrolipoyl dehydrogenase n=1 Tax=Sphingobium lignivorans TaxID=2735886 RepID=A0ABR6NEM9_9SPHN|nr:dihydrolipoyl dehydrogenase [Sphingobium lignivorans]MBB5984968.1 dihydrolipoamide dehydrogenase [Sphingobium lignivorans]